MTETEADDYNLNSEGRQQTLHISLVNDKQTIENELKNYNFKKNINLLKLC